MLDDRPDFGAADFAFFRKWFGNANFDPTGGILTAGMMMAGAGMSAAGTIAGGNTSRQAGQLQKTAADYQAAQLDQNATQAVASSQRQMIDTGVKTGLAISSSRANAAANGVEASTGSAATNTGNLAARGSYQALMDLFNGQSTATGLRNQAQGVRYTGEIDALEGEEKQQASWLAAGGTLLGGMGGGLSTYGKMKYQTPTGQPGASL